MFSDDTIREFERVAQEREDERAQDEAALGDVLAKRLKAVRAWRDMTRTELAALSGVSRSSIVRIESAQGSTSIENVEKIAAALHVTPTFLIGGPLEPPEDYAAQDFVRHAVTQSIWLRIKSLELVQASELALVHIVASGLDALLDPEQQQVLRDIIEQYDISVEDRVKK